MAADIPNAEPMRSAYLTLRMDSEAERSFSALSNGGKVLMPMREEFFASRFGQVRDRFGINWMISPRASYAAAGVRISAVKPTLRRDTDVDFHCQVVADVLMNKDGWRWLELKFPDAETALHFLRRPDETPSKETIQ